MSNDSNREITYRFQLVPEYQLESISDSIESILGYGPEDFLADPLIAYRLVLPEDLVKLQSLRPDLGPTGPIVTRLRHKDGRIVWLEHYIWPIRDEAGTLVGLEGRSVKVEPEVVQESLYESEARLRMGLQSANIALWEWNFHAKAFSCYGLESLLGLGRHDKPPATVEEAMRFVHPADVQRLTQFAQQTLESKRPFETDFRIVRPDDSVRWMSLRGEVFAGADGRATRLLGHLQDITEKKNVELALMESEERLRLALEAAEIGIWDWDIANNQIRRTGRVELLYGRPPGSLSDIHSFSEAIHPEDRNAVSEAIRQALEHDAPYNVEFRVPWSNGDVHWIGSTGRVWRNKDGTPYRMMGYVVDITKRKAEEAAMRAALDKAEEANRVKSAIFANISHEIRTPMTTILGYSDLLTRRLAGSNLEKYAQTIYRGGSRLLHLLNSIVDLARIEAGKTAFNPVCFSARESIDRVANLLRVLADQKTLAMRVEATCDCWLQTDVHAFEQVLTNIVGNAIRFTETGSITILLQAHGEQAQIQVRDTGVGISSDFINQVFDEFRQESEGFGRTHEGSGLGLSITKKLIERMGGTIAIASQKFAGTTVTVSLPLADSQVEAQAPAGPRPMDAPSAPPSSILVIEDDEATGELLRQLLGSDAVVWYKHGDEGLEAAAQRRFAVILIDIHLRNSRLDGLAAMRELRRSGYVQTPIIALTAYAMHGDRERFLEAGFDDYIAKPFQFDALLETVNRCMKKSLRS